MLCPTEHRYEVERKWNYHPVKSALLFSSHLNEKKKNPDIDVSWELAYIVEISTIFIIDGNGGGGACVCLPVWDQVLVRVRLGR